MLSSKIIERKNEFVKSLSEKITDFMYATFKFPTESGAGTGIVLVSEYENMRPDTVANRIYGDQSKWDVLLKYNGISNPFSLEHNDILYSLPFSSIETAYVSPRIIPERETRDEIALGVITDSRDKDRIKNLKNKASFGPKGKLPPNLTKEGDKNVKLKDGKLVFGEDVTTVNKDNCPTPISRARLQRALVKDKLFL